MRAPVRAASISGLPLLVFQPGELNDENGVLGRQTDEHDQPDLRINIVHHLPRQQGAAKAPKTAMGVPSRTLKGRLQLSYKRGQNQETQTRKESPKMAAGGTPCAAFCS